MYIETIIIILIICGIGCGMIASSKNMSVLGWIWLGVLTSPLGLLIIGFMKTEERDGVVWRNGMGKSGFDAHPVLRWYLCKQRCVDTAAETYQKYKRPS